MTEFEWDAIKEVENIKKHSISFFEAVETFADPHGIQLFDRKHSDSEERYYWIGKSKRGKILTTWFVYRNTNIRIIGSAEFRKMRKVYYEATKTR
jgi:uncharacterized DUF497 family protein